MDGRPMLRPWMGGVPRLASSLATSIKAALGDDQLIIATTGLRRATDSAVLSFKFQVSRPIPNKLIAFLTFTGLSSFDRLFRDQNADVLLLPNLEFVGRPRMPYALLVHDLSFLVEPRWFDRKSRIWHALVKPRSLIRNATHLFTVSETTKRDLIRLLDIDPSRITVIPMGLDPLPALPDNDRLSRAHDHAPLPQNGRFILCLGGSNTRKNASCVLAAHAMLVKNPKFQDVDLVICGGLSPQSPPPGRGARGGATHLDRPSDTELFSLMRDASIFCYPSWYEGFGIPLHEAARFGTPCIASTSSSLPETAPEGTTFASPAKPHHWVEAICQVLDNPEKHRTKTVLGDWSEAGRIITNKLREIAKA